MTIYGGYHLKINPASQYAILKMSIHICQTSSPLSNYPTLSPCGPDNHVKYYITHPFTGNRQQDSVCTHIPKAKNPYAS